MDKAESYRIHKNWWGKCRTCKWWKGGRASTFVGTTNGPCASKKSPLFEAVTTWDGHCPEWDSFDIDIAMQLMEEGEQKKRG